MTNFYGETLNKFMKYFLLLLGSFTLRLVVIDLFKIGIQVKFDTVVFYKISELISYFILNLGFSN